MALDIQRISLDISKQPTPQQVRLGQGDANATQLIVDVFDEGVPYSLTSYSVRLQLRLPNDGGYYQVDGAKSGNTATFDIDETYAASTNGFNGFGYVDILSGDTVICSTSRFQLVVLQCASDGVQLAPQYIDAVNDAINRANAAAEAAEGVVLQDVPLMSATIRGGAQLGDGLTIVDGKLTASGSTYQLPTMSANTKGGAKLGAGLSVADDTLSANVTGIKGDAESTYRTGNVNLTPANIGAANATHTHSSSDITSGELPITHGGTGASSASDARTNLGITPANIGAAAYSNGAINIGGTSAYLLFTTSAIASFSPPTGVSACMVLDTSDNGLYWYTS